MNKFSVRIKKLREKQNLSQNELADALHLSQTAISKWESGTREPTLDIVLKIAIFFNCSTDFLIGKDK